jgi:hypothetical protein
MKMPRPEYDRLKEAIRAVVGHFGQLSFHSLGRHVPARQLMWSLFWVVPDNWHHDDKRPVFTRLKRPRIAPLRPGWDMYAGGLNDRHYDTALLRIGREPGLVEKGD